MITDTDRNPNPELQRTEDYLPISIPADLIPDLETPIFFRKDEGMVLTEKKFHLPANFYVKKTDYISFLKEIGDLRGEENKEVKMLSYTSCFKYHLLGVIENPDDATAFRETINLTVKNLGLYSQSQAGADDYVGKLSKQKDLLSLVMFRTMVSVMMAKKLGWSGPKSLSPLIQASLFCDTNLIFSNPDHHLSQENIKVEKNSFCPELHQHVLGLDKTISDFKITNENVIMTIKQHHENNDGSGPLAKKGLEIYPLAKVLRLADFFSCRVLSKKDPLTTAEALKAVYLKRYLFDQKFSQVLVDCFN